MTMGSSAMAVPDMHHLNRPLLVGVIVFLLSAIVSGALVWQFEQNSRESERARVARLAADHVHSIEYAIEHALFASQTLAALVRQGQGRVPDFASLAATILPLYPGVSALALAPDGIVRDMAPGNRAGIGLDLLNDPALRDDALRARDSGKLTLAGPLELAIGGTGIVGRLPVFLEDRTGHPSFWGFTMVVMRLPEALDQAHLNHLDDEGLAYELWRVQPGSGKKQVVIRSSSMSLVNPVVQAVQVPNATWMLSVAPAAGWAQPFRLSGMTVLALVFSLMLGYLAWLLFVLKAHKQLLEARVEQRTAEILMTQRKLRATLDAIPDLVWLKDTEESTWAAIRYSSASSAQVKPISSARPTTIWSTRNRRIFFARTIARPWRLESRASTRNG